jgi:hypothetical protein
MTAKNGKMSRGTVTRHAGLCWLQSHQIRATITGMQSIKPSIGRLLAYFFMVNEKGVQASALFYRIFNMLGD